jgi:small subunit ribosomal protein S4
MAKTGVSGDNLLQMLETRLDSVVYRAGFTNTMGEARQLVTHKHIMVDGKCINVPSFQVKPGMKIQISEKMQNNAQIRGTVGKSANQTVPYLEILRPDLSIVLKELPARDTIPVTLDENMVIEYYSK